MRVGDIETATNCIILYLWSRVYAGKSLHIVDEDYAVYESQILALSTQDAHHRMKSHWQTVHNLMGLSTTTDDDEDILQNDDKTNTGNTIILTGEVMDEEEFLINLSSSQKNHAANIRLCKKYLCLYFGEYETGAELALTYGDEYQKITIGNISSMFDVFSRAVCLYAAARKVRIEKNVNKNGVVAISDKAETATSTTRQNRKKYRKYKKEAKRLHTIMNNWLDKGNPNVIHHCKILDAERTALSGNNYHEALDLYRQGGVLAAHSGLCQDAALAHERKARTILEEQQRYRVKRQRRHHKQQKQQHQIVLDVAPAAPRTTTTTTTRTAIETTATVMKDVEYHLKEAMKYYSDWGADAKIDQLEEEFKDILLPKSSITNIG